MTSTSKTKAQLLAQLDERDRALRLEAALERVRSPALGMQ
jgi:hypothetical protein